MGRRRTPWIWAALTVQLSGLVFDYVWHGFLHPDFEAVTVRQMVSHLRTVHLPLYVGVLSVLCTTAWAVIAQARWSRIGIALPVALVGACVSTVGEAWHAYTHLHLSTHSGPLAEATAFLGCIVVVTALWQARLGDRQGITLQR